MSDDSEYTLEQSADDFLKGMACLKAAHPGEGADLLRRASAAGHAEAQQQLARLYFATLRTPKDLASLEMSAQSGDHVASFVFAMVLLEGRLLEKNMDAAIIALRHAAKGGNLLALHMLEQHEANTARAAAEQEKSSPEEES